MSGQRRYFGTDGMRGTANQAPIEVDTVLRLALAAGTFFQRGGHRHTVVIGKDTRLSCYMLENALTAGFSAMGMDVILTGPMPTPAVAMLTRSMRADVGVMISASHNPFRDNGIKLFGPDGFKLSDDTELEIEQLMDDGAGPPAEAEAIGRVTRIDDAPGRYIEAVKRTFPEDLRLDGMKVVVDCANGAAYKVAPIVLAELGATVIPLATTPNGKNINANCGATHPDVMCGAVLAHGADIGLALDGDADRLIVSDETGSVVDGDQLMALIAGSWSDRGALRGSVVATVMSNLGFERYLTGKGIDLTRTKVGDRYVVDAMRAGVSNLGGEQSGHIVLSDYATTGDGLIAALQVLAVLARSKKPMSKVGRIFERVPQKLHNIRYHGGAPLEAPSVQKAIRDAENRLNGIGRLVIRPSGTEPLIRVMAEADDANVMDDVIQSVTQAIEQVV